MDTVSNEVTYGLALSFPNAIILPPKFLKTAGDRIKTAGIIMKKLFLTMALLAGMATGMMAQTAMMQQNDEQECMEMQVAEDDMTGDNSCTLTVYYSDGSVASSVKVTTDVSGGISCMGGRDFYTNDKGVVTLYWSEGCYLKKVYVKGNGYDVDYKNGNRYSLTLKR